MLVCLFGNIIEIYQNLWLSSAERYVVCNNLYGIEFTLLIKVHRELKDCQKLLRPELSIQGRIKVKISLKVNIHIKVRINYISPCDFSSNFVVDEIAVSHTTINLKVESSQMVLDKLEPNKSSEQMLKKKRVQSAYRRGDITKIMQM